MVSERTVRRSSTTISPVGRRSELVKETVPVKEWLVRCNTGQLEEKSHRNPLNTLQIQLLVLGLSSHTSKETLINCLKMTFWGFVVLCCFFL